MRDKELDKSLRFSKERGIIFAGDERLGKLNAVQDSLALFCDASMVDYVSWSETGMGWNSTLENATVRRRNVERNI